MTYGGTRYGEANYGGEEVVPTPSHKNPWRVNSIRIEALLSESGIPAIIPGASAEYRLYLKDDAVGDVASLRSRYEALLEYLEYSQHVVTYPTERGVYYRNQSDHDQLVIIEPIAAGSSATGDIETRDSEFESRWAVVTGGQDVSQFPDGTVQMTLETTTLARGSEYGSRESIQQALERTGI